MNRRTVLKAGALAAGSWFFAGDARVARAAQDVELGNVVDAEVQRLMIQYAIPGMVVGITHRGRQRFYAYGVASIEGEQAVTDRTLFEVGSISKTFTGLLGGYALARGEISLSDPAETYLPELADSALGRTSLLDLATYTAGGLPLQFPDAVVDYPAMMAYFRRWKPDYPAGAQRQYSNPSIGLFGYLVARGMGRPFNELIEQDLLPGLGLTETFLDVPASQRHRYAFGYTKAGAAVRVGAGMLDAQAYGIKTTARDLLRFVETHLFSERLNAPLRRAVASSLTPYYQVGAMQQGLGWELYARPASLDRLLQGNAARMLLEANPATRIAAPLSLSGQGFINKTGSTNGFGAYAAFIPARHAGLVMLANKNYPNLERVRSAYAMLSALDAPV